MSLRSAYFSANGSLFSNINKIQSISNIFDSFISFVTDYVPHMYTTHDSFRAIKSAFECVLHKWRNVMRHMKIETGPIKFFVKQAFRRYMFCLYSLTPGSGS